MFAVFSCKRDDPVSEPVADEVPESLALEADAFSVSGSGETVSLTVNSPTRPKVSGVPDWIGFRDGTFNHYKITYTFTIRANPTREPRQAAIVVSAEGFESQTVTFSQEAGKQEPEQPDQPAPDPPAPGIAEDGWENAAAAVINMRTGWNLGNTLDTWGSWLDGQGIDRFETGWGQPLTRPELMQMFADAGFGAVRVPVTWRQHMDADGKVDKEWMDRVEEVVNYVLDTGMYCILNVHHDTGAEGWLRADKAVYNNTKDRFITLWEQIAVRFKDYGPKLLFESFNEMLDAGNNWNEPKAASSYTYIDNYNQDFVNTVRATGENNARRNLVINDYCASSVSRAFSAMTIPEDIASGHIIAEFHSYSPYMFAMYEGDGATTTWTVTCEKEVRTQIETLAGIAWSKGVPFIIGEYGSTSARSEAEIAKQCRCYVETCKEFNAACFCWMLLSDGADRSVPKWTRPIIKDAIINASR